MASNDARCDVLVIGSGPGGSLSAALFAQAGLDVILAEEGGNFSIDDSPSYSLKEMEQKYRHGGLSVSMGNPKVTYIEACCVGGASEINAGLYHRPLTQTLDEWGKLNKLRDFSADVLEGCFKANERELSIAAYPNDVPKASQLIRRACEQLHWQSVEVPRLWHYGTGRRQSMSETYIPKFINAKGRLLPRTKIVRLVHQAGRAIYAETPQGKIYFDHVFICAGAIQTPFLLQRSRMAPKAGRRLCMHPAVRVVAKFNEDVFDPNEGVPVYQVSEFKPEITLGGSYSGKPHLALWLSARSDCAEQLKESSRMAIFYALARTQTLGSIKAVPLLKEPLVFLPMGKADWALVHEGLERLKQMLQAAGATDIFFPKRIDLSTIHLFASCPMGEDTEDAVVDSYGKLMGMKNVYLNDSSILPGSPGVNPQAVIMAIARRNAEHLLREYST